MDARSEPSLAALDGGILIWLLCISEAVEFYFSGVLELIKMVPGVDVCAGCPSSGQLSMGLGNSGRLWAAGLCADIRSQDI